MDYTVKWHAAVDGDKEWATGSRKISITAAAGGKIDVRYPKDRDLDKHLGGAQSFAPNGGGFYENEVKTVNGRTFEAYVFKTKVRGKTVVMGSYDLAPPPGGSQSGGWGGD